jgi:hypothetical protein
MNAKSNSNNSNRGRGSSKRKKLLSAAVNTMDDLDSALSLASTKRVFLFNKSAPARPSADSVESPTDGEF